MKISVVIPTINSIEDVKECIASLRKQTLQCTIIVVANGSTDGTQRHLSTEQPDVVVLSHLKPLGFAGAVNQGIRFSVDNNYKYVALLNNDAAADRKWLEELVSTIERDETIGIVTSKIKHFTGNKFDSTGDFYTSWFLPYARGRNVRDKGQYDTVEAVVSGSGGASLYRIDMFKKIGIFDEDFFAYYEDMDVSLRAHHGGWKVLYQPAAVVRHKIGATSSQIRGFTTLQTMKNLPLLMIKNVPFRVMLRNILRFKLAYIMFFGQAIARLQGYYALKGWLIMLLLIPRELKQRRRILSRSQLSAKEFNELLIHDLPPRAYSLKKLRRILTFGRV